MKNKPPRSAGRLRVLAQDDARNYEVELEILRSGRNRNGWDFRNIEQYAETFRGTPILCAYVGEQIGDGHNMRRVTPPDAPQARYTFLDPTAERIVGEIYDTPNAVRTEQRGAEVWIIARGKLWRFYNPELVDKIVQQRVLSVSAEVDVTRARQDADTEIFESWQGLGVTILGDGVEPAIPGAHIQALRALRSEFDALRLRAAAIQKTYKKGVNAVSAMNNKVLLEQAQQRFPDHQVIGLSEDGTHVLMLSRDDAAYAYHGTAEEHGVVIPERMQPVTLSACYQFADGVVLEADVAHLLAQAAEPLHAAQTALAQSQQRVAALESQISAMRAQETVRRQTACEQAVQDTARDAGCLCLDPAVADAVLADVRAGKYNEICDADGSWIGDKRASEAVLAHAAALAIRQLQATQTTSSYAFDENFLARGTNPDAAAGTEALIHRMSG